MIAVMKMSGRYYGRKTDSMDAEELETYLEEMTSQGTAVTMVCEIEDACDLLEIELEQIEMVY